MVCGPAWTSMVRQKSQVSPSNTRKTAEVIVEAGTRALRHIQRGGAFKLVSA